MLRTIARILPIALMMLSVGMAHSQNYPNKPIRITTTPAGGLGDLIARLVARGISGPLGQQVIVVNQGGDVTVLALAVAKAAPDGHSLLLPGSALWITPLLRDKISYDPIKDFEPIITAASLPNLLVVHPSLGVNSVKELIAVAKARPGEINYASAGTGSTSHLAMEMFKTMAGVNMTQVPYKGTAPALADLLGGQVQVMFVVGAVAVPQVKAGKLRALGVSTAQPSALFPGLTTVAASGLPNYEMGSIIGMFAPARTPSGVITRLNQETARVLNEPEVREQLFAAGSEVVAGSPEQFANAVKLEMTRFGKLIKDAGIHE